MKTITVIKLTKMACQRSQSLLRSGSIIKTPLDKKKTKRKNKTLLTKIQIVRKIMTSISTSSEVMRFRNTLLRSRSQLRSQTNGCNQCRDSIMQWQHRHCRTSIEAERSTVDRVGLAIRAKGVSKGNLFKNNKIIRTKMEMSKTTMFTSRKTNNFPIECRVKL